jgi:hypothetical protein
MVSIKYWVDHSDPVLSELARRLMRRDLLAIELQNDPFREEKISSMKDLAGDLLKLDRGMIDYFVFTSSISNLAYAPMVPEVRILKRNGYTESISSVSDMFDHRFLSERIIKYFLCYPKECR